MNPNLNVDKAVFRNLDSFSRTDMTRKRELSDYEKRLRLIQNLLKVDFLLKQWKEYILVRLFKFYFGGSKLVRFINYNKTEHSQRKLLYFVNRPNAESPKIGHNFKKITKNGLKNGYGYIWMEKNGKKIR